MFLYFFVFGLTVVSAHHVNFYRKDYTYFIEYDAFYKLHKDGSSWNSSFLTCDDEGAELFYPTTDNEWEVATKLLQAKDIPVDVVGDIFVGIHDHFALGEYITLNGQPTNISIENVDSATGEPHCVVMDIQTGVYRTSQCDAQPEHRPFICKKVEGISCPTIDKAYTYVKEMRKCYKVNNNPRTWSKAMETCFMEGGSLVVLESNMESNIINGLLNINNIYHAGFKKMFPINEFYTIKGHKLQDSGFVNWYDENRKNNYDCGAYYNNGNRNDLYLYALNCDDELWPFICEMDIIA